MKYLLMTILVLSGASAFAQSATSGCLSSDEAVRLQDLRSKQVQARANNPECEGMWGAAACLSPIQLAELSYLESKEAGDMSVCR